MATADDDHDSPSPAFFLFAFFGGWFLSSGQSVGRPTDDSGQTEQAQEDRDLESGLWVALSTCRWTVAFSFGLLLSGLPLRKWEMMVLDAA